ncbi:hypothetical protein ACS0TY_018863 [Phlomoides rotata]
MKNGTSAIYRQLKYQLAFGRRIWAGFGVFSRNLCSDRDDVENGFGRIEDFLNESWKSSNNDPNVEEKSWEGNFCGRKGFVDEVKSDAARILEVLHQDCPGFDAKPVLSDLGVRVSGLLVREVLFGILKIISYSNKNRCAKLGFKFFVWSSEQEDYRHTTNAYHMMMEIFAECEEFKAMWRLFDDMIEKGYLTTARTFNILICTCGEAGIARKVVERFIKSKTVLHFTTLIDGLSRAGNLEACQYFFDEMVKQGCVPDVVSYTVMITGYVVAGQVDKAREIFSEMINRGQLPNVFTYNSMIRGLCMDRKFDEALLMLKEMESRGCNPNFLVYTTIVGYLRNAGKLYQAHEVIKQMVEKGRYCHLLSKIKRYRRC